MKATGIVRRIDELGRIVIPKEIRRTLRIREGEPLEIFTENEGSIVLKKYSPIVDLEEIATQYAESMNKATGFIIAITDKDHVVTICGQTKKMFNGKEISDDLEELILERKSIIASSEDNNFISIINDYNDEFTNQVIVPIISDSNAIGSVIFLSNDSSTKFGDTEMKLAQTAAIFLALQMEQ